MDEWELENSSRAMPVCRVPAMIGKSGISHDNGVLFVFAWLDEGLCTRPLERFSATISETFGGCHTLEGLEERDE
jgi:hypothetical protein